MKCLVPVKCVVDPYVKVRVKPDQTGVETAHAKKAMNPFDEIAMEAAVQLKEQGKVSEIIAVSIGSNQAQEILRQALARGADSAQLVECEEELQPLTISKILKQITEQLDCQLIIMGKQAIDDDSNQTGQMLSALLDWPQATFASAIEVNENSLCVTREIDGGLETIEVNLPAVVTTDLRLNEPRYISLPNVMKAKKKPLETRSASEFEVSLQNTLEVLRVTPPPERASGKMVESVDELVNCLRNEAKVV